MTFITLALPPFNKATRVAEPLMAKQNGAPGGAVCDFTTPIPACDHVATGPLCGR